MHVQASQSASGYSHSLAHDVVGLSDKRFCVLDDAMQDGRKETVRVHLLSNHMLFGPMPAEPSVHHDRDAQSSTDCVLLHLGYVRVSQ